MRWCSAGRLFPIGVVVLFSYSDVQSQSVSLEVLRKKTLLTIQFFTSVLGCLWRNLNRNSWEVKSKRDVRSFVSFRHRQPLIVRCCHRRKCLPAMTRRSSPYSLPRAHSTDLFPKTSWIQFSRFLFIFTIWQLSLTMLVRSHSRTISRVSRSSSTGWRAQQAQRAFPVVGAWMASASKAQWAMQVHFVFGSLETHSALYISWTSLTVNVKHKRIFWYSHPLSSWSTPFCTRMVGARLASHSFPGGGYWAHSDNTPCTYLQA